MGLVVGDMLWCAEKLSHNGPAKVWRNEEGCSVCIVISEDKRKSPGKSSWQGIYTQEYPAILTVYVSSKLL
jgi:hypothetical protein